MTTAAAERPARAGRDLANVRDAKATAFLGMLKAALAGPAEARDLLDRLLQYDTWQQRLTAELRRALVATREPATEQFELPFAATEAPPTNPRKVELLGLARSRITKGRVEVFSQVVRAAAKAQGQVAEILREYLRLEAKQSKFTLRLLQTLTPRVAGSRVTQVLDLVNGKQDKVWPRSTIVSRMVEAEPGCDESSVRDGVDDALRTLVQQGMIERIGHGLYRALREGGDE